MNRLEISLDGSHACALFGSNLQEGEAAFVKIEGWPKATYKQEQAAMRAAYEELCAKIGERLPFDIVREHGAARPEVGAPRPESDLLVARAQTALRKFDDEVDMSDADSVGAWWMRYGAHLLDAIDKAASSPQKTP